jgi:hypothetical protein
MSLKKSFMAAFAIVFLACVVPVGSSQSQGRQIRLLLSPRSNVDPVEIIKHLSQKCPNVVITHNRDPKASDYLLDARWYGDYRFQIVAHGGDTVYVTETTLLSNSVKDICKFLNSRPAPGTAPQTY